jgi:hypothetical protein
MPLLQTAQGVGMAAPLRQLSISAMSRQSMATVCLPCRSFRVLSASSASAAACRRRCQTAPVRPAGLHPPPACSGLKGPLGDMHAHEGQPANAGMAALFLQDCTSIHSVSPRYQPMMQSDKLSCRSWQAASHLCFRSFSATGSSSGVSSGSAPLSSYLGLAAFFGCSKWHRNTAHGHWVHR